jgi:dethiobiotin synthetase
MKKTDTPPIFEKKFKETLKGLFITGTDTGIGKTCISAGILHLLAARGLRVGGLKPVAAGMTQHHNFWSNDDVTILQSASNIDLTPNEISPCQLRTACAPHIAARLEGITLSKQALLHHIRALSSRADAWVIEGVGGFCVPMVLPRSDINDVDADMDAWGMDDLAVDLNVPVVLVVGLRLGCLNHAVLTAHAIRQRGLRLVGWIGNCIDPGMLFLEENLAALHTCLSPDPCLGIVPDLGDNPQALDVMAALNDSKALLQVLDALFVDSKKNAPDLPTHASD